MKAISLFILIFFAYHVSYAQLTGAARPDSAVQPAVRIVPQPRPLPPSMQRELGIRQTTRTSVYRDTITSAQLEREHESDSTQQRYADSAVAVQDTVVSLTHQSWLNSQLADIPELIRGVHGIRYRYPHSVMVDRYVRAVPFDSTIVDELNPISRENLPYFDQSPMPYPLPYSSAHGGYVEVVLGNVHLPSVLGYYETSFSERTWLDARLQFDSRPTSAIQQYAGGTVGFHAALGTEPAEELYQSSNLEVRLQYNTRTTEFQARLDTTSNARRADGFAASALLVGDVGPRFHYDAELRDDEFGDAYIHGVSESSQTLQANLRYQFAASPLSMVMNGGVTGAALSSDDPAAGANSSSVDAFHLKFFLGHLANAIGDLEWYAGFAAVGGDDALGQSYSIITPAVRVGYQLSEYWNVGGYYDPNVELASLRRLEESNPFYSPVAAASWQDDSGLSRLDVRSAMMDRIRIGGYTRYSISVDDEIRADVEYLERRGEPVFSSIFDGAGHEIFVVHPEDTRRLEVSVGSNLLFFQRDVLSTSIAYHSATATADDAALPFEATFSFDAIYHFNSLSTVVKPTLEFRQLSRRDRTISLVNVGSAFRLSDRIGLSAQVDNVFGSASDFWTGYTEMPRSVLASIHIAF